MNLPEKPLNTFSNKFAAGLFFSIFSLLFFLFTKYTLLSIQSRLSLPLFPLLFLVVFASGYVASKFGNALAKPASWYRVFFIGLLLAIIAILLISLVVLCWTIFQKDPILSELHNWKDYFVFLGLIFVSITLIIGVWLIPLTGLAAIYFNRRFLPGLKAVDETRHQD